MTIRPTRSEDAEAVVALQPLAFPPPFDPAYHWQPSHIRAHVRNFPDGQFVAEVDGRIVASCSNVLIDEATWTSHAATGAHPYPVEFPPPSGEATTLYGADIAVLPEFRRRGIARALYAARYHLVGRLELARYGTACRLPDFATSAAGRTALDYARDVVQGNSTDRTLTPLLRMNLLFLNVVPSTWPDPESGDSVAILERRG